MTLLATFFLPSFVSLTCTYAEVVHNIMNVVTIIIFTYESKETQCLKKEVPICLHRSTLCLLHVSIDRLHLLTNRILRPPKNTNKQGVRITLCPDTDQAQVMYYQL